MGGVLLASNEAGRRFEFRRLLRTTEDVMSLAAADGSWAGWHVVETAPQLPLPRMISRVRQSEEPQCDPQRKDTARPVYCSKQRYLSGSIGNSGAGERESGHLQQNGQKPQQCDKPLDTAAQLEYFLLETEGVHVNNVDRDDLGASRRQPAARG